MDEDFEFDANTNNDDDPQWTSLTTEQKKELMSAVFEDDEWYSGTPAHIGGQSLPEFGEIASRLSAPKNDIHEVLRCMGEDERSESARSDESRKDDGARTYCGTPNFRPRS